MHSFKRFTSKNIVVNLLLVTIYLLWCQWIGGIRPDHINTVIVWLVAYYAHETTRKFILGFSIFIIYWIIYDSMRVVPNYTVATVHIQEPYEIEKSWFGIMEGNTLLTPNEYWAIHHRPFLDFLSGVFYINWVPIPLLLAAYFFWKSPDFFIRFSLAFLLVNLVGFVIYYIYPAAPPWYVEQYGFDLKIGVPGSRAGLERFDELIHYPLFQGIYNKNANVLAAMPSLHSTYPLIVLYYGLKKRLPWWINTIFVILMVGIWGTAVYTSHHYLIDVIYGVIMAIIVLIIFEKLIQLPVLKKYLLSFEKQISL